MYAPVRGPKSTLRPAEAGHEENPLSAVESFVPLLDHTRARVDAETGVVGRGACATVYKGTYELKRGAPLRDGGPSNLC